MTDSDSLPLLSGNDCSPVPVFNCQIILSKRESDQKIVGRVANLAGISVSGNTERDVLMQITRLFVLRSRHCLKKGCRFHGSIPRKNRLPENRSVLCQSISRHYFPTAPRSLWILYSTASTSAIQLASMMFSLTPTVLQTSSLSRLPIRTRTRAAVPSVLLMTRTL